MAEAAGFGDSIGHSHALAGMLLGTLANKRSTVSITEKQSTSITLSYAEAHRMPPPSNTETAESYISKHRDEISARIKYAKNKIIPTVKRKNGIIVFKVQGWEDAARDFTLWDGERKNNNLLYVGSSERKQNIEITQDGNRYYLDHLDYYPWMIYPAYSGRDKKHIVIQITEIIFRELK